MVNTVMLKSKVDSNDVLRTIAWNLGTPFSNLALPYGISILLVVIASNALQGQINAFLLGVLGIACALLLGTALAHFYVAYNGKRILSSIEKDYGPRTRQSVYRIISKTKNGEFLDLDIPALAQAFREAE